MFNLQGSLRIAASFAAALISGCAQSSGEEPIQPLGEMSEAIIGGAATASAAYGAVGALVYYYPEVGVLDVVRRAVGAEMVLALGPPGAIAAPTLHDRCIDELAHGARPLASH